ncbi:C40 family peptidase [Heyndrickxia coagulans]|uniref:C40 family peptidase n=1 Tax=Heyndrickxia coagulans TaxID=1398 RepID=UPI000E5096F5|nr:LysM peptidoglycan-binding domain-containing protein [Heyndrickxia coagulans]RGR83816.1 LysM peptidoglycan-binding domain-containing protein [Heyndrickxia coagulans]RGR97475.1 LysM peptidoglycan-binding domain-containing protein [Heyndrickxia coagulans]
MTRKKVLSVTAGMTLASLIVGSASTEAATYTVKKGDSLWKISQQYHTTVSQIKNDNHLTGDIIYPNQKFKVPSQTPKKYKIVSGDTLSGIAKKYGVKVSQLKEWNHLNSDLIYAGDTLKINSSSATTSSTANSTGNSTANSTSNSTANNTTANSSTANNTAKSAATQKSTAPNGTYQIVKGDTLSGVAQKFGVTVSQLKEWNHLSSDWIVAGSALKVDGPSSAASSSNGSSTQSNQSSGTASSSSNAGSASSQTSGSSSTQSSSQAGSSQSNQSSGTASSSSNAGSSSNGSSSSSSASTSSSQANSSRAVSKKVVSSSKSSSYSGSAVAQIAQKYIGAPYRFGGTTPAGFDCSGFVYYVLNEAGKSIGRLDAAGFYNNSYRVSNPQPGDLIFFENTYKSGISDVGIYLGNNQFISDSDKSVSIKSLDNSYWKSHFNSIRRLY